LAVIDPQVHSSGELHAIVGLFVERLTFMRRRQRRTVADI